MLSEVAVIIKDEERTYTQKFLVYEQFCLEPEDPVLKMCIAEAHKNFHGQPDDVKVRITIQL